MFSKTIFIAVIFTLIILPAPTQSFLQCPTTAHLATNELIGSTFGSSRFPSSKITLEFWAYFHDVTTPMGVFEYTMKVPGTVDDETTSLSILLEEDKIEVQILGEKQVWNLPYQGALPVSSFVSKEWFHIAIVWSSSTGNVRPYVNGKVAGLPETIGTSLIPNKGTLRLFRSGSHSLGVGSSIAEFRIWNEQMTEKDVIRTMQTIHPTEELFNLELFAHYRLSDDATASLEDLQGVLDQTSSSDLPHSLQIVVGSGDPCFDSEETDLSKSPNSVSIASRPRSYFQEAYDQASLLGSGLASDPSFNVDAGEEVSVVSFDDDNMIGRSTTEDELTLDNQQSMILSGCSETEQLTSTKGVYALGTRAPLMAWIPKSFRGSNFAIPTLRGDTLTVTVRSLSSELTSAEMDDTASSVTQESVRYVWSEDVDVISSSLAVTESPCIKRQPYSVTDLYEGGDSTNDESNLFDGNSKTGWLKHYRTPNTCDSALGSGYPHCVDVTFGVKTAISRYSLSNTVGDIQPQEWELYGRDDVNDPWSLMDTKTNVLWNSLRYITKDFWSNQGGTKYKHWRLKFLKPDTERTSNYYLWGIELSEIELYECDYKMLGGGEGDGGGSGDRAKGSDLITMHVVKKKSALVGTPMHFGFGSKSMQTDVQWSCTGTEPKWYWRTTEYSEEEEKEEESGATWTKAVVVVTGTTTTPHTASFPSRPAGGVDLIWHANPAANEVWCRMSYGEAAATLTLTNSFDGSVLTASLPRDGTYQFALARGSISSSNFFKSWFVLQATTSVVVSARSSAADSRAVPAVSQRFVGFSSYYAKAGPFYDKTDISAYYYSGAKLARTEFTGGIDAEDDTTFIQSTTGVQYLSGQAANYECAGSAHVYGSRPLGIATYNDRDGSNDATTFFPIERLSTEFILPKKAEWASFVTVRPSSKVTRGIVQLKVYDPQGRLIDVFDTEFARESSVFDSNTVDDRMRPSCFKYEQVSGIPAGTRFVTDYPSHMVFDEYETSDETAAFGRGTWGWVQMDKKILRVKEKDTNPDTSIQQYRIRFQSHDADNELGFGSITLGRPTSNVKISLSTDAEITASPSSVIFTKDNWNQWQTINVTAVEDNKVETMVTRSIIRHFVDTLDPNFADGRINVPDVVVDVINVDFDSSIQNLKMKTMTGGMIGLEWSPPAATLASGNTDTFNYIVEMKEATSAFAPPTILTHTSNCTEVGCTASSTFVVEMLDQVRSASITVLIRRTDFDSATEIVESITTTISSIEGGRREETLRSNCNPGAGENAGYCGASDAFPCVQKQSVLDLLKEVNSTLNNIVTVEVTSKISKDVGPTTNNECKDDEGKLVGLLTMDVALELVYRSEDEVYNGDGFVHHEPGLKHSTSYRVRAATMSNHGVLSAWSDELLIKTTRPTMPTAPVAPTYARSPSIDDSRTGGSLRLSWSDVFDTGGAPLVEYHTLAMEVGPSGGANDAGAARHNTSSFVPDSSRPWTDYSIVLKKEDNVVGLKSYSIYNMTVYALNDVEFCVGNNLVGYSRAHILLDCGFSVSDTILLTTSMPTRPEKPLEIVQISDQEEEEASGGSVSVSLTRPHDRGGHSKMRYDVQRRLVSDGGGAGGAGGAGSGTWDEVVRGDQWWSDENAAVVVRLRGMKVNKKYEVRCRASTLSSTEDPFTNTTTDCECEHDKRRTDCACCFDATFKQCGSVSRNRCYDPQLGTSGSSSSAAQFSACSIGGGSDVASMLTPPFDTSTSLSIQMNEWGTRTLDGVTLPSTFTFSLWISLPEISSSLGRVDLLSFGTTDDSITLSIPSGGEMLTFSPGGGGRQDLTTEIAMVPGVWMHVAVSRSGRTDMLYVNGEVRALQSHSFDPTSPLLTNAHIVMQGNSNQRSITIDNVQLWSSAMDVNGIRDTCMSGALSSVELATIKVNANDLLVHQEFNEASSGGTTVEGTTTLIASNRGYGEWSNVATIQTPSSSERPHRPTNKPSLVSVSGGSVQVAWDNSADNGGTPIVSYRLYRTVDNPSSPTNPCTEKVYFEHPDEDGKLEITTSSSSASSAPYGRSGRVVRLLPSTNYGICVASMNSEGESDLSPPLSITTTTATEPGAPPSPFLIFNLEPTGVVLKWDETMVGWIEPANVGGSDVIGYFLEWMKEGDTSFTRELPMHDDLERLNITLSAMVANTLYTYRVIAVNGVGESPHSVEHSEVSSAKCLERFYGDKCESFGLCDENLLLWPKERTNAMRMNFCQDLAQVVSVSRTYGTLFGATPSGNMGRGAKDKAGSGSAQPLPTLSAALAKINPGVTTADSIFLYPDVLIYDNEDGYCDVVVDKDVEILGVKNGTSDWLGTTIRCTNETGVGFDRFLFVSQGVTVTLSSMTLKGGGVVVSGGMMTVTMVDVFDVVRKNDDGGGFLVERSGTLSLDEVLVRSNQAVRGGGVACLGGSTLSLCGTDLESNTAEQGGGIFLSDATLISSCSDRKSRVRWNKATLRGGGLHCEGGGGETRSGACVVDGSSVGLLEDAPPNLVVTSNRLEKRDRLMMSGAGMSFDNVAIVTVTRIAVESNTMDGNGMGGGVALSNVGVGTLTSLVVRNNIANVLRRNDDPMVSGGGGISISKGTTATVVDCLVLSNVVGTVGTGGGVLVDGSSDVAIAGGSLESNLASGGGGIDVQGTSKLVLKESVLVRDNKCSDGGSGGGVSVGTESSLLAKEGTLIERNVGGHGGGVSVSGKGSTVSLEKTSLVGNLASNGGALALLNATSAVLSQCIFSLNKAQRRNLVANQMNLPSMVGHGGDIFSSFSMLSMSKSSSSNATADGDGGSIWLQASNVEVDTTTTIGAAAQGRGGALAATTKSSVKIESCIYDHVSSEGDGGVIWSSSGSSTSLLRSTVRNSFSLFGSGGVVGLEGGSSIEMIDTTVKDTSAAVDGGVLSLTGLSSSSLVNVVTTGCIATENGGVLAVQGSSTVAATKWTTSGAKSGGNGGAVSIGGGSAITMSQCTLERSSSMNDGGHFFVAEKSKVDMIEMVLDSGSALRGGAMFASESEISHDGKCRLLNNVAIGQEGGGSLFLSSSMFIRSKNNDNSEIVSGSSLSKKRTMLSGSRASNGGAATVIGVVRMDYLEIVHHATNNSGTIHVTSSADTTLSTSGTTPFTSDTTTVLTLDHVTMGSNVVGDFGGHVYVGEGASLVATTVSWANGTAGRGGGAVYSADGSLSVSMIGVDVRDNRNTAIVFEGKDFTMEDSILSGNHADRTSSDGGGAIQIRNRANATLLRSKFRQNIATNKEGGDVACTGMSSCLFDLCSFLGGTTTTSANADDAADAATSLSGLLGTLLPSKGGAVAVTGESTATILRTTFNGTHAKIGGGAIHVSYSTLHLHEVFVTGARSNKGAALLLENAIEVDVADTEFRRCESVYDGGAIHATASLVRARRLILLDNRAGIFGGAVLISERAEMDMEDSTMVGNVAWLGGALAMDRNSRARVKKTIFTSNQARMGGAFYVSVNPDVVSFEDSTFDRNTARFGSAMFIEFSKVELRSSTVRENAATLFAAIRVTGIGSFEAWDSSLLQNTAQRGGALYADDTTVVTLHETSLIGNEAEEDGGAIYASGASSVQVYGCDLQRNVAKKGEGGAISRTRGASLVVSSSATTKKKTTFMNNVASTVGGAMSLNSLLCRSAASCMGGKSAEQMNTMTTEYENCRSGEEEMDLSLSSSTDLVPCTDIQHASFVGNKAAAGAGIFWYRQWHIPTQIHAKYLPCPSTSCSFENNLATPCDDCDSSTSPGCFDCMSNIQTDTQTVSMGWSPGKERSIQSGTPIENNKWETSPEDTDIFLVAMDYYGQLSRLDDQSNCYVERDCSTVTDASNCFDVKAGTCRIQNLNADPMANNKLLMSGTTSVASGGIVRFVDLIVKADPNPQQPYFIRYVCRTTLADEQEVETTPCVASSTTERRNLVGGMPPLASESEAAAATMSKRPIITIQSEFVVDHCAAGSQMTGDQVCERCSAGKYSPNGMRCTDCPTGGSCDQKVQISKKSVVVMGVATPIVEDGYFNETAPPDWVANECNTTKTTLVGKKSPHAMTSQWGNNEECQPGDCVDDVLWSVDRLHRCRRNINFYKCDSKEACQYEPATIDENGTARNVTFCGEGYEGVQCGVCKVGYHKTGNDLCIQCMGDDPVVSQALYTGALSLTTVIFFLMLYLHLRDKGLKFLLYFKCLLVGLVRTCRCCHSCWCKCSCLRKKEKLTKEELAFQQEIRDRKHHGKRRRGMKAGEEAGKVMEQDTVWFRPEKYKILLSFLQVFQEFRRTYRIKWPPMVEEYMEYFSGLVDFDIFRLTAVDCLYPYTYLHKVWFAVVFPSGCLLLLICCHFIGKHVRSKALRLNARIINGESTGFHSWPPRKAKKKNNDTLILNKGSGKKELEASMKRIKSHRKEVGRTQFVTKSERLNIAATTLEDFRSSMSCKARCCGCLSRCWGRLLNLEHAALYSLDAGPRHHEIDSPEQIKEVKNNVAKWKKRVLVQIHMAFFMNKIIRIFFWILLLSFIPVTSILLRFFLCDPIAEHYYLNADLRVVCDSSEYNDMMPIALFGCFFYILGIPCCFFAVLSSARNENVDALTIMLSSDENERARYLAMARADVETEGGIFTPPHTTSGALSLIQAYMRRKNLRSHKTRSRIGFIVQSYSEWAWWYEMWELFRKLLLVGAISLYRPGTVMQILLGLGICVGSSFVSLLIRPYAQLDDGWLNNLCLAQLMFVLFCGLLIRLDVDLFAKEGKGDSTYDAQYAVGLAVVGSHIAVMVIALCLLSYELANAPRHQAALRASLQRKREAARRNLELWAKGRRTALMRKAKRDKDGGGDGVNGPKGNLKGEMMDLETEQLAREAELRDEYDDLQKEIQSLGQINSDGGDNGAIGSTTGSAETDQFLLDEKTRMERAKKKLELQMQSIINENKTNEKALETMMDANKIRAKRRLDARLARRKDKKNGLGTIMKVKRAKSMFKRGAGIQHDGTKVIPIKGGGEQQQQSNASTVMHLQDRQKQVHLEAATLEAKNDTIFKMLAYFGVGDASIDESIEKYVIEHRDDGIDLPRDDVGSTLLVAAVRTGNIKCATMLLKSGADVTLKNNEEATALHYAAFSGNRVMVDMLLKSNDSVHFLNAKDGRGNTAAAYAVSIGKQNLAKRLGLSGTTGAANLSAAGGGGGSKSSSSSSSSSSDGMSKWRRAAWRKGIAKVHEKRNLAMNWKQTIALARAQKSMQTQLNGMGEKSFDPAKQEEHDEDRKKLEEQVAFLAIQLETATKAMDDAGEEKTGEIAQLKQELEEIKHKDELLMVNLEQEATERRRLHNAIEDMKGAIRVFCRMRPLSSSEIAKSCIDVTEYLPNKTSIRLHPGGVDSENSDPLQIKSFSFDSVFSPVDGQEEVFRDVSHLVQSAADGYNVCIFAYGQTGSGKTYTMNGVAHAPGVQPRSVREIFNIVTRDSDKMDFKISTYMIEMYLDGLIDLLKHVKSGKVMGECNNKGQLVVRKDANGQVVVNGVTHCVAKTAGDLEGLLDSGMRKRHVASTKMNSESSRSHLIATIMIEATDRKTKLTTTGKLTLVDLAGSESQKKTGATGNQLKEAKAINSSLSALGAVISALTSGKDHIPYRNSKLTELLQDGLGGSAKCLMFVNASPADYNITETAGSFEFALRCKKIKNSKSGATVVTEEVRKLKEQLAAMEKQMGPSGETKLKS